MVLQVEQSGQDLGAVGVASFRLGRRFFLLSQITDVEDTGVTVWLDRRQSDDEEASLAALVEVLGIPGDRVRDRTWCPHPVVQRELRLPPPPEDGPGASRWTRFLRKRRRPSAGSAVG
ncbi:hypothetical protein ABZY81_34845 [Streptomyces sp. NPDC006514]|uniref:hypothetical protein n=1 Tax=Streptomyces sp. NPDC006514 TaxID=3154308 RepID=UPI0033B9B735